MGNDGDAEKLSKGLKAMKLKIRLGSSYLALIFLTLAAITCGGPEPSSPQEAGGVSVSSDGEQASQNQESQPESQAPALQAQKASSEGYEGVYRPVGFVNHGSIDAMVMPCTWVPEGADTPSPAPSVSTISTNPSAPGLWPNPSRFLSLPLGTYTWCIQFDQGDQDEDGVVDDFYFIDGREVTLNEESPEDLEFARQVDFSAPPGPGTEVYPGVCSEAPQCVAGGPQAIFITGAAERAFDSGEALEGVEYDAATVTVFIDPQATLWIAWNNAPEVSLERESRPGERFLGPGGFGTDDYIRLTITDPDGFGVYQDLDFNDAYGRWKYTQNVIYGSPQDAPNVFRQHPSFADPPNQEFFIDEQGAFEDIFTITGEYRFDFSFCNKYTNHASHPDIYLLIASR
jgi:hypothetical protein